MLEKLRLMWAWIQRWGGWIIGPLITLVFVLLGRRRSPSPVDTTVKDDAEKKTTEAEKAVVLEVEKAKTEFTVAHDAALLRELQKETEKATEAKDDVDKVNEYLTEAGKAAREK